METNNESTRAQQEIQKDEKKLTWRTPSLTQLTGDLTLGGVITDQHEASFLGPS